MRHRSDERHARAQFPHCTAGSDPEARRGCPGPSVGGPPIRGPVVVSSGLMTLEIGAPAPDFTLTDHDNQPWTLSAHRGSNVVLVFYPLDFSPTCTRELTE